MKLKALFRQYDYPNNVISGTQGSAVIAGTGTKFTEIPVYTAIETSDGVFLGQVASVASDTSLTLDRLVNETFSDKAFWMDWSMWRISTGQISRKVESENEGQAGAIVFDNVSMEFYFGESLSVAGVTVENPVYKAFQGDIDSKKRFLIRLQAIKADYVSVAVPLVTNLYQKLVDNVGNYLVARYKASIGLTLFEGMIDFSSVEFPAYNDEDGEFISSVGFEVVDKLSALSLVDPNNKMRELKSTLERVITLPYKNRIMGWMITDDTSPVYIKEFGLFFANSDLTQHSNLTETIYKIGDIIVHPDDVDKEFGDQRIALVTESYLVTVASLIFHFTAEPTGPSVTFTDVTYNKFKIFTFDTDFNNLIYNRVEGSAIAPKDYSNTQFVFYDRNYYGGDIGNISNIAGIDTLTSFNGVNVIKQMLQDKWGDIDLLSDVASSIPLEFYEQLINEFPFDKEPLDALVYLAFTMNCYVFINKDNVLTFVKKKSLDESEPANDLDVPYDNLLDVRKRVFWDKLVDSVTITVNSWIKDGSGVLLTGEGTASKRAGKKPRNELKKEIFIDIESLTGYGITINADGTLTDPTVPDNDQGKILDHIGELKAVEELDFYGKRHIDYQGQMVGLTWEMLQWDLISTFSFVLQQDFTGDTNNGRYFLDRLGTDIDQDTMEFELVSISRKVYDDKNILIGQMRDSYLAG